MRLNRRIRLRLGDRLLAFNFQFWNVQVHDRIGIRNVTPDGYLVPFWDFIDSPPTRLDSILGTLKDVQKEFDLSTISVIQSWPRPSYRAVCFDKLHFKELLAILSSTTYVDENYIRSLARRKFSVLRVVSKKDKGDQDRLITQIENYPVLREQSLMHQIAFKKLYGIQITGPHDLVPAQIQFPMSKYESLR